MSLNHSSAKQKAEFKRLEQHMFLIPTALHYHFIKHKLGWATINLRGRYTTAHVSPTADERSNITQCMLTGEKGKI